MPRICDLPKQDFEGSDIDHMFYVECMKHPTMRVIKLRSIFDWIKEQAIESGLTVKFTGDNIIFIKK